MKCVGRAFPRTIAVGLLFLCPVVLLPACAHAPVGGDVNLSGRWEGASAWANVMRAGTGYKPTGTTQQMQFTMRLVRSGDQITGTGTVSAAGMWQGRRVAVNIAGTVVGNRVRLRMVAARSSLRPIVFTGTVFGADRMRGSAGYDEPDMQDMRNPTTLKRVGAPAGNLGR